MTEQQATQIARQVTIDLDLKPALTAIVLTADDESAVVRLDSLSLALDGIT